MITEFLELIDYILTPINVGLLLTTIIAVRLMRWQCSEVNFGNILRWLVIFFITTATYKEIALSNINTWSELLPIFQNLSNNPKTISQFLTACLFCFIGALICLLPKNNLAGDIFYPYNIIQLLKNKFKPEPVPVYLGSKYILRETSELVSLMIRSVDIQSVAFQVTAETHYTNIKVYASFKGDLLTVPKVVLDMSSDHFEKLLISEPSLLEYFNKDGKFNEVFRSNVKES